MNPRHSDSELVCSNCHVLLGKLGYVKQVHAVRRRDFSTFTPHAPSSVEIHGKGSTGDVNRMINHSPVVPQQSHPSPSMMYAGVLAPCFTDPQIVRERSLRDIDNITWNLHSTGTPLTQGGRVFLERQQSAPKLPDNVWATELRDVCLGVRHDYIAKCLHSRTLGSRSASGGIRGTRYIRA